MGIARLSWDSERKVKINGIIVSDIRNPPFEIVEEHLRKMTIPINNSFVGLKMNEQTYMSFGGGDDGFIFVDCFLNGNYYIINDKVKPQKEVILTVGGQWSEYTEQICVSLEEAIEIAKYFFDHQDINPDYKWEYQFTDDYAFPNHKKQSITKSAMLLYLSSKKEMME